MNIPYLIMDLLRRRNFQAFINARYKEPRSVVLDREDISYIVTKDNFKFKMTPDLHSATSIYWRYMYEDIRHNDRVIDLGANVGGFAILATKFTRLPVLAVEPVRYEYLKDNVTLNGASVKYLHAALGNGDVTSVTWREGSAVIKPYTLRQFKDINGGCDFLKIDVEGAEWGMEPSDLDGIRRIEGQLHNVKAHRDSPLLEYLNDHYAVTWQASQPPPHRAQLPMYPVNVNNPIFHAVILDE